MKNQYPELNLPLLKERAADWFDVHGVVEKLSLYRTWADDRDGENPITYVLIATVPRFRRLSKYEDPDFEAAVNFRRNVAKEKQDPALLKTDGQRKAYAMLSDEELKTYDRYLALSDYYQWIQPDCGHVRNDLSRVIATSPDAVDDGWMWYNDEPGEDLNDYIVDPESEVVLYPISEALAAEPATSTLESNQFRNMGDYFEVTFRGKSFSIKKSVGLRCIATLLSKPGWNFSADDLLQAAGRVEPIEHDDEAISKAKGFQEELKCDFNTDGKIDEEACENYKKYLIDLEDEIRDASGDHERLARLRHEKESIEQQLIDAFSPGGRPKSFRNDQERKKDALRKSMKNAILEIDRMDKNLAEHLRQSIKPMTPPCSYRPSGFESWEVIS